MKDQKGLMQIIGILIIVAGLVIGVVLVQNGTNIFSKAFFPGQAQRPTQVPPVTLPPQAKVSPMPLPPVNNRADLENVLNELDSSDIDGVGSDLSQNDADASNF